MAFNFKKVLGIDLGTDTTQVYLKGVGLVLREPSIVAFNNRSNRVVAVGKEAKKMLARTPAHITALRPMSHGIIADFDMAREMLERFFKQGKLPWSWATEAVVSVPTNLTEVERKSVEDLLREVGASPVHLIEQPLAAAFGMRLEVGEPTAFLIIDMGAGTTDAAILSLNGIVVSHRLKIGGDYLNTEIIRGMREEFKLAVGEPTAEEIKLAVGTVTPTGERLEVVVRGRDVSTGLPREVAVKDSHVRLWLLRPMRGIVDALKDMIETAPPELAGDIHKNGMYLCGGGGLLRGIADLLEKEIGVRVALVEDPLTCVVRGVGVVAEDIRKHAHLVNNFPGPKIKD
ncbi:MAG: rod shape-determining protein [Candidatus Jorgensenbacteria bacterium]|nr:rod shape-determining protein [Candidatus Jorgensenbacteria bacterium]